MRDTDRDLALLVGAIPSTARLGSAHLADAHVVAVELEGAIALTTDADDLERLAARHVSVTVVGL